MPMASADTLRLASNGIVRAEGAPIPDLAQ